MRERERRQRLRLRQLLKEIEYLRKAAQCCHDERLCQRTIAAQIWRNLQPVAEKAFQVVAEGLPDVDD